MAATSGGISGDPARAPGRLGRGQRPLRILPGTHLSGVLSDAEVEHRVRSIQPVACLVPMGGVVALRPLLLHASSKAESDGPRRVLHIEYADSLDMGDGLRLAIA